MSGEVLRELRGPIDGMTPRRAGVGTVLGVHGATPLLVVLRKSFRGVLERDLHAARHLPGRLALLQAQAQVAQGPRRRGEELHPNRPGQSEPRL